ncbi:MAG TPA: hypothetical protein VFJ06_13575 [Halococcus sp.]|nr:hypothetical protein [Halococcus sp.]
MRERDYSPSERKASIEHRTTSRRTYLRGVGAVAALGIGSLTTIGNAGAVEPLPRKLTACSATTSPTNYSLSVSDAIELGDLAETGEDRIEGTTASGIVGPRADGDSDTYRFGGDLLSITDEETFRFDIDPGAGRLTIAALGSPVEPVRYVFSVDGTLRAVDTDTEDSILWYLGFGAVSENPDIYAYTGEFTQLIAGSVDVEVTD